jgi:hypothetical protein
MSTVHSFIEPSVFESSRCITQSRRAIIADQPTVLTDIYQKEANIIIWQRQLTEQLALAAQYILQKKPTLQVSFTATADSVYDAITEAVGDTQQTRALRDDISLLVDMFCCLFDLKRVGLRLNALNRAMCPRFHVDRVPCRLVTTYQGIATQWLPHNLVDRSKLGAGSLGKSDEESAIYQHKSDIEQLNQGNVALLKGEMWHDNEGAGLVHRSPQLEHDNIRLFFTLDFID